MNQMQLFRGGFRTPSTANANVSRQISQQNSVVGPGQQVSMSITSPNLGVLFNKIKQKATDLFKTTSVENPNAALEEDLRRQIVELKEHNAQYEQTFARIRNFIESDPLLQREFFDSLEKTKEILLPPPGTKNEAGNVKHALVEEWRIESHRKGFFLSMKTRFNDFLEKNPKFAERFQQRFNQSEKKDSSLPKIEIFPVLPQQCETISSIVAPEGLVQKVTELDSNVPLQSYIIPIAEARLVLSRNVPKGKIWHDLSSKNQEAAQLFRLMKRRMLLDSDTFVLFKTWVKIHYVLFGLSYLRLNDPIKNLVREGRIEQSDLLLRHFFTFLDANPEFRALVVQNLHVESRKKLEILR